MATFHVEQRFLQYDPTAHKTGGAQDKGYGVAGLGTSAAPLQLVHGPPHNILNLLAHDDVCRGDMVFDRGFEKSSELAAASSRMEPSNHVGSPEDFFFFGRALLDCAQTTWVSARDEEVSDSYSRTSIDSTWM